jgi:hypothetical protein
MSRNLSKPPLKSQILLPTVAQKPIHQSFGALISMAHVVKMGGGHKKKVINQLEE